MTSMYSSHRHLSPKEKGAVALLLVMLGALVLIIGPIFWALIAVCGLIAGLKPFSMTHTRRGR
jgi:hypothetical protein